MTSIVKLAFILVLAVLSNYVCVADSLKLTVRPSEAPKTIELSAGPDDHVVTQIHQFMNENDEFMIEDESELVFQKCKELALKKIRNKDQRVENIQVLEHNVCSCTVVIEGLGGFSHDNRLTYLYTIDGLAEALLSGRTVKNIRVKKGSSVKASEMLTAYLTQNDKSSKSGLDLYFEDVRNDSTLELWYSIDLKELLKPGEDSSKLVKLAVNVATEMGICEFDRKDVKLTGCDVQLKYTIEEDRENNLSVSIKSHLPGSTREAHSQGTYLELDNDDVGVIQGTCKSKKI